MKIYFKGYVFLGCECSGKCHSYENLVPIDLSQDEVKLLQTKVSADKDGNIVESLRNDVPELYEKIDKEATLFAIYATLHEGLINGSLEENLPEDKRIEDFILEDINSGIFHPNNTTIPEMVKDDWYKWEQDYLGKLSYLDRIQYIAKRYGIDEECINCIDNEYSLFLPDEL